MCAIDYKTDHLRVMRHRIVPFEKIPVDTSYKMSDDYVDTLNPFDYSALKESSTAYLPGYVADKYDVSVEQCAKRADSHTISTADSCLRRSVSGYELVMETRKNIRLNRGEVIPVWLLSTRWNEQNWLFAMNGQTGNFIGELPVDQKKAWSFQKGKFCHKINLLIFSLSFPKQNLPVHQKTGNDKK